MRCMRLWLPVDAYLGLSVTRRRLLEVPTFMAARVGARHRAIRLEACLLLHLCIIIDVKLMYLRRGKLHCQ
jgi:hypothetical protein